MRLGVWCGMGGEINLKFVELSFCFNSVFHLLGWLSFRVDLAVCRIAAVILLYLWLIRPVLSLLYNFTFTTTVFTCATVLVSFTILAFIYTSLCSFRYFVWSPLRL